MKFLAAKNPDGKLSEADVEKLHSTRTGPFSNFFDILSEYRQKFEVTPGDTSKLKEFFGVKDERSDKETDAQS